MRRPRLLAPPGFSYAIYHCVSRIVNRDMVLGEPEKEQFVKYMRLYAKLYGLNILTFCIMDNHFYRSMLVESGPAVQGMAAYVDLNPIRAGIVSDPKDYRWSGYGEATAGRPEAQAGLRWLAEHPNADGLAPAATSDSPIATVFAWYREQLYGKGKEVRNAEGAVMKRGFTEEEIQEVIKAGGRLPLVAFLRLRVRYFSDGAVIGSQAFVESVFQAHRKRFSEKRQSGSRRLRRLDFDCPLRVARALAVRAVE